MPSVTEQKKKQLQLFIKEMLEPDPAVQGVVAIGSMPTGHMGPDSDIDMVVFLDPFDYFVVPAEAIWDPEDGRFHSIFTDDQRLQREGIPLDFARLDWQKWADPDFAWPEGRRAELSTGWLAYDREGRVADLIAARTQYPTDLRLARLDEAIIWLEQHLAAGTPERKWDHLGPVIAHDRLHAAYDHLVAALFAYNRRWRGWRNREMQSLLALPWLPPDFGERVLAAANAPASDRAGYMERVTELRALFADLLQELVAKGDYSQAPIDQAFMRLHEEPGRAWNMETWRKFHLIRLMSLQDQDEAPL